MVGYYLAAVPNKDCEYPPEMYKQVLEICCSWLHGRNVIDGHVTASDNLIGLLFSDQPITYEFELRDQIFLSGVGEIKPTEMKYKFDSLRMRALGGENMWEALGRARREYGGFAIAHIFIDYDPKSEIDDFHQILRGGLELVLANLDGEVIHSITKNR